MDSDGGITYLQTGCSVISYEGISYEMKLILRGTGGKIRVICFKLIIVFGHWA
jgi:hypothetical protein